MSELHLQDKFLIPFFRESLGYQEVKANTVTNSLIIEEDLQTFISTTELNQKPYETLLKKYSSNAQQLLKDLIALIQERIASSRNMALFINANKSVTLEGIKLHLFYTDDSVIHDSSLFEQNIFSVVQELPYKYKYQGKQIFSFRPDICLFVNGIYLGYSELKSNLSNQTARKNGRGKVIKDYFEAVRIYYEIFDKKPYLSDKEKDHYRKDFLKIFEKAIHITTTDIAETYVIRTIDHFFDEILTTCREGKYDREEYEKKVLKIFKPYPLLNPDAEKKEKLKELFTATPDDHTLARFGEFSGYAESEKLWVPFDSYTMNEAIKDGFILNPLKNIVPVASKMLFDLPSNELEGFEAPNYKDADKKQIYENRDRIHAIAQYIADLLVKDVYRQIRGTGKAMLAVYSIKAAIAYKQAVTQQFNELVKEPKYAKYADAPIYIIYSSNQDEQSATGLNDGLTEEKVLENFALKKNGLIIVVAKLQTGFDEKKLHTLFLDKEIKGIAAIQAISRVNRITKYKNDCKIVDFSYNNVNVQNIKEAFEYFSDVVVSDFDPFCDQRVLDILFTALKKSDVYEQFFDVFLRIYNNDAKQNDPEGYLDLESSIEKYINANPKRTADTKAKAAQYFTILNRIEYVITLDAKYSEPSLLEFLRLFNTIYNRLHRTDDVKDAIEVYFDNQIGIIEVQTKDPEPNKKQVTKVAQAGGAYKVHRFDILAILEARNEQEDLKGERIREFEAKIRAFFSYIRSADDGKRLVVKINSNVSEDEIYDDFAKIYRKYKVLNRKEVGDYFFKETEDLVNKLCDDFETIVRNAQNHY